MRNEWRTPHLTYSEPVQNGISQRTTAEGLFLSGMQVKKAIEELKKNGFSQEHIGVAARERNRFGRLLYDIEDHLDERRIQAHRENADLTSGSILNRIAIFFKGLSLIAVPNVGPVITGGIITDILGSTASGIGITGYTGGIFSALVNLGIPVEEAHYFEKGFKAGGILLVVKDPKKYNKALEIMEKYGAETSRHL